MPLRVQLVSPAPPRSLQGNGVTARRWSRVLRALGAVARITSRLEGAPDILVSLHARKTAAAARAFRERFPDRPLVVALTGTDLYHDLARGNAAALESVRIADRLILLQEAGRRSLPRDARAKARVVHQSLDAPRGRAEPLRSRFEVAVLSHLRAVKDPLRAAMAVRRVPSTSRLAVVHVGAPLERRLAERARRETETNPRYEWRGERPRAESLRLLARSRLLVVSSRMEGGANVVGEAAVSNVPVLATRVEGNLGLLGRRHPGLFDVGDTAALRALLLRAESDARYYERLRAASVGIAPLFAPERERAAWKALLDELDRG